MTMHPEQRASPKAAVNRPAARTKSRMYNSKVGQWDQAEIVPGKSLV